jgi:hypothetical protein
MPVRLGARGRFLLEDKMNEISGLLILVLMLGVVGLAHQAPSPPASGQGPFQAMAVSHAATIRLTGPVEKVFPLFGPVREKEWAPGWSPELVYPADGEVAEGMVFKTAGEAGETLWVIMRYDPDQHIIVYANVTPGYMVNRILISCTAAGSGQTDATVAYIHVALGEQGNSFVRHMDDQAYVAKMEHWRQAINYRLETGKTIPAPH